MKLLFFTSYSPSVLTFRLQLLREIARLGHTVFVVVPSDSYYPKVRDQLSSYGITCIPIALSRRGLNPFSFFASTILILVKLLTIRPDIFVPYTLKPILASALAYPIYSLFVPSARLIPYITGLGSYFTDLHSGASPAHAFVICPLYKRLFHFSHHALFQNPDDPEYLRQLSILPPQLQTTVILGSGIDTKEYPVSDLPSQPIFLCLSRLLLNKGLREYIEAASIIKSRHPSARFLLAGMYEDGPSSLSPDYLRQSIDSNSIEYLGHVENVYSLIAESQCYVLASYREGLPRSVLEAMSVGRPIITTDVPGCRETVIPGVNGYLVQPRSVSSLVNALDSYLSLPNDKLKSMSLHSRSMVERLFCINHVNRQILSILLDS